MQTEYASLSVWWGSESWEWKSGKNSCSVIYMCLLSDFGLTWLVFVWPVLVAKLRDKNILEYKYLCLIWWLFMKIKASPIKKKQFRVCSLYIPVIFSLLGNLWQYVNTGNRLNEEKSIVAYVVLQFQAFPCKWHTFYFVLTHTSKCSNPIEQQGNGGKVAGFKCSPYLII